MNRIWIFLIAVSFSLTAIAATERGISIQLRASEATDAPVSETVQLYNKSYALVIGIDDYTSGWPRLSMAVQDAEAVAEGLREKGFEVILAKNLNSSQLRERLRSFFAIKGSDPDARLLLWFAGHGHTINGEGFLVPVDAPIATQPEFLVSALHMRDFGGLVRLAESKHVLSIFDSCFSGTIFTARSGSAPPAITAKTIKPVRQFLTSGDGGQQVRDDGSYRKLFLRAINGEDSRADPNRDGYVTGEELGLYLSQSMADLTQAAQIPKSGKLHDVDYNQGDFVFLAPLTTSRNLPALPSNPSFSLIDIQRKAAADEAAKREEEKVRKAWEDQLSKMTDAFNLVRQVDGQDTTPDNKITAWERFQQAFTEDNPYSSADESMRTEGQSRIEQLERERELANEQLASTVLMPSPGSRPGSTFKD
ncbi:MAG: caspase family protein, partial [Gammaproteobacteria bacterium]|nr:caspase family protein [Gammaproteobacteria bacterium]